MKKYFNIAGPCNPKDHYMVPAIARNKDVEKLIDEKQYFVVHAARQTGKTSLLKAVASKINSESNYYALYCSLESTHVFNEMAEGIKQIYFTIKNEFKYSKLPRIDFSEQDQITDQTSVLIKDTLRSICSKLDKPFVLFFDEVDCLEDALLITFLRQLRDGYISRDEIPFPQSIALVGMRNIRDYKSKVRENKNTLGSASPFNIITKALTINNFTFEEVKDLYNQHTQATGQLFEESAVKLVYEQSSGQPWLVNAIARECTVELLDDYSKPITSEHISQAIQNIILRRDTHIDSLLDKLSEERVRRIIEPMILGNILDLPLTHDDVQYCFDLGLIKDQNKQLVVANAIYNEVIIRTLTYDTQYHLNSLVQNVWIDKSGRLEMNKLLKGFQEFWRENSEIWINRYFYREAAPHLILQAFLQRVINGGGDILREYAVNRGRIDICVKHNGIKYPIELKIMYSKNTLPKGIEQLTNYIEDLGETTGWLVIFNRDPKISWDKKIYWQTNEENGKTIHIVGA
jgi:AAA+ ATPase superfamily predicted ATPase